MTLEQALDAMKDWEDLLWTAYWRIVRSVPVEGWRDRRIEQRYPRALITWGGLDEIKALDESRRRSRAEAQLFAAALQECSEGRWHAALSLAELLERQADASGDEVETFADLSEDSLHMPPHEFIRWIADPRRQERTAEELDKLQAEVGLNLYDFVEDFADTVAFADFKQRRGGPESLLTSSCIVRQDTTTLTTTATVTALAEIPFETLTRSIDPLGWPKHSDVIKRTCYLEDAFDLDSSYDSPLGEPFDGTRYLYEDVGVDWGTGEGQTGEFQNVLAVDHFHVDHGRNAVSLPFRLYRSVESRMLWDVRAGGILIDEGFLRARRVGEQGCRVTTRKILKFSDRTPNSNPPGWRDMGELINCLTPAAVTWWLETEFASAAHYRDDDVQAAQDGRDVGDVSGGGADGRGEASQT